MINYQYYIVLIVLTISDINSGIGLDKNINFCYNKVSLRETNKVSKRSEISPTGE